MPAPAYTEYAFQHSFDDFDAFSEAAVAWELNFRPLRRPSAATGLALIGGPTLQLSRAWLGCHCDQSGSTPVGFRTFGVPLTNSSPFNWAHQPATADSLLVFGADRALDSASLPNFSVYTLSLAEAALETCDAGRRLLHFSRGSGVLVHCRPGNMTRLRGLVAALLSNALSAGQPTHHQAGGELIPSTAALEIANQLWESISASDSQPSPRLALRSRRRILAQARDWALSNPATALSVTTMSTETGISERSLRRAFVDHYGVAPKEYLRAIRLLAVRRQLQQPAVTTRSIATTAGELGFWHSSQFAADYRCLFGELPSSTLARSSLRRKPE